MGVAKPYFLGIPPFVVLAFSLRLPFFAALNSKSLIEIPQSKSPNFRNLFFGNFDAGASTQQ